MIVSYWVANFVRIRVMQRSLNIDEPLEVLTVQAFYNDTMIKGKLDLIKYMLPDL